MEIKQIVPALFSVATKEVQGLSTSAVFGFEIDLPDGAVSGQHLWPAVISSSPSLRSFHQQHRSFLNSTLAAVVVPFRSDQDIPGAKQKIKLQDRSLHRQLKAYADLSCHLFFSAAIKNSKGLGKERLTFRTDPAISSLRLTSVSAAKVVLFCSNLEFPGAMQEAAQETLSAAVAMLFLQQPRISTTKNFQRSSKEEPDSRDDPKLSAGLLAGLPPAVRAAVHASGLTAFQLNRLARSPMVLAVAQQVKLPCVHQQVLQSRLCITFQQQHKAVQGVALSAWFRQEGGVYLCASTDCMCIKVRSRIGHMSRQDGAIMGLFPMHFWTTLSVMFGLVVGAVWQCAYLLITGSTFAAACACKQHVLQLRQTGLLNGRLATVFSSTDNLHSVNCPMNCFNVQENIGFSTTVYGVDMYCAV
eukprot:1159061-Pelagomonas_calceolata.AAC.17